MNSFPVERIPIGTVERKSRRGKWRQVDELERRVESLEHRLVTRDVLDGEIRSLERRLRDVRELTEG